MSQLISAYGVGGAAIAFWILFRFPRFGPRTLLGSGMVVLAALLLAAIVPACVEALVSTLGRTGAIAALLGLVLPTLAAIFWSAACLMRVVAEALRGPR